MLYYISPLLRNWLSCQKCVVMIGDFDEFQVGKLLEFKGSMHFFVDITAEYAKIYDVKLGVYIQID